MSDKMREALEWIADEMRSELTDDGASLPQWLVKSWLTRCTEALAEQPAQGEAGSRPTFNEWWLSLPEGRRKALIDDKWALASAAYDAAAPAPAVPEPNGAEFMTICTKCKLEFHACECAFNSDAHAFRCTKRVLIVPPAPGLPQGWMPVPVEPTRAMVQAGAKLVKENKPSPTGARDIYIEMLAAAPAASAPAAQPAHVEAIPNSTLTAPERIFLCLSDEEGDEDMTFPRGTGEVMWAEDQAVHVTVEYVRADLRATPAPAVPDGWRDAFIAVCGAWDGCDRFVSANFARLGDAVVEYPVLQGTSNQLAVRRVGRLAYDGKRAASALRQIAEMLAAAPEVKPC